MNAKGWWFMEPYHAHYLDPHPYRLSRRNSRILSRAQAKHAAAEREKNGAKMLSALKKFAGASE